MATTVSPLVSVAVNHSSRQDRRYAAALITGLTCLAVLVHGYHPYAEDGGLYLAGVKRLLDPGLYARQTGFVEAHLRFSVFAPVLTTLVRWSRLRAETAMFLLYAGSIWTTLFTAWKLTSRCYNERAARTGAVALLAVWLTLPVAGTSLMLMDPYVTARSISTPCALIALVGILDLEDEGGRRMRGLMLTGCALMVGLLFHPLMTAYAAVCVAALAAMLHFKHHWPWTLAAACLGAVAAGELLQVLSVPESAGYTHIALTRAYWFLSQWQWYEWFGLAGPLALLAMMTRCWRDDHLTARLALARMSLTVGIASIAVALFFARVDSATHLVARFQPLRIFQMVYVVMILCFGAEMSRRLLRRSVLRWAAVFASLIVVMLVAEQHVYPASAHIEWRSRSMRKTDPNPWVRAFVWVRNNTPRDALLALDADYIEKPGEDAQCFRAIAERSALPDYSKDGGEASITPSLTPDWIAGESAQEKLSAESDEERITALAPFGVDWVVMEKSAVTSFACDYANEAVKVCRMPWERRAPLSSSQAISHPPAGALPQPRTTH